MIVVLSNREDSMALLLEAERQGLMKGDYVFFLVQHFEVSGGVVSTALTTQLHNVQFIIYHVLLIISHIYHLFICFVSY